MPDPNKTCQLTLRTFAGAIDPRLAANFPGTRGGKAFTDIKTLITSLTMNYKLSDELELTSVTGGFYLDDANNATADRSSFAQVESATGERDSAFSQEVRLNISFDGPLNFAPGGYFDDSRVNNYGAALLFYSGIDPATGKYENFDRDSHLHSNTYSAFGTLRWKISPKLELAGGVRYSRQHQTTWQGMTYLSPIIGPLLGSTAVGDVIRGTYQEPNWSPEATLTWKPTNDLMLYAAYKTGFKSGGFSLPSLISAGSDEASLKIQSEKVKGGELGMKGELLDRSLLLQATVYRYRYGNVQVASYDAAKNLFFIRNGASLRVQGVEFSANWRATHQLSFNASASYNKATYISFPNGACYTGETAASPSPCIGGVQDLSGTTPPRAPRWGVIGGVQYDVPIGHDLNIGASVDASYTSKFNVQ